MAKTSNELEPVAFRERVAPFIKLVQFCFYTYDMN